ncbi:MAG: DUF99 family protein [Candidatus Methanosuratincola petrocarbonis]|nr:DUF99 family protein [Candidatus Methanosuratincola sp.]
MAGYSKIGERGFIVEDISISVCGGKVSPFKKGTTPLVLLTAAGIRPVEVKVSDVDIDGMDATEKIVGAITSSKWKIQILFSRSVPVAGFNLIDPEEIFKSTGVPSVFVLEEEPDSGAVEGALRKHFHDWKRRLEVLRRPIGPLRFEIPSIGGVFLGCFGITPELAFRTVSRLSVFGKIPEPLRVCCMLSKAIS